MSDITDVLDKCESVRKLKKEHPEVYAELRKHYRVLAVIQAEIEKEEKNASEINGGVERGIKDYDENYSEENKRVVERDYEKSVDISGLFFSLSMFAVLNDCYKLIEEECSTPKEKDAFEFKEWLDKTRAKYVNKVVDYLERFYSIGSSMDKMLSAVSDYVKSEDEYDKKGIKDRFETNRRYSVVDILLIPENDSGIVKRVGEFRESLLEVVEGKSENPEEAVNDAREIYNGIAKKITNMQNSLNLES